MRNEMSKYAGVRVRNGRDQSVTDSGDDGMMDALAGNA